MRTIDSHLISPHGGKLLNLIAEQERQLELKAQSRGWPSWTLSDGQLCDMELILNGGFSPLRGFMSREDYESVCSSLHLKDGTLWPLPITLDVTEEFAKSISDRMSIALRDYEGVLLAVMSIEDIWKPDRLADARSIYKTNNPKHPGVSYLLNKEHAWCLGGRLEGIQLPIHYDFRLFRLTPQEIRSEFTRLGWRRVISFQATNVMHRVRQEFTVRVAKEAKANLLIHPEVGITQPGDLNHYSRVRCYQAVLKYYPKPTVKFAILPFTGRQAGTREAILRGIVAKNYGCSHFIIDSDLKTSKPDSIGAVFIGPDIDSKMMSKVQKDLGAQLILHQSLVYVEDSDDYLSEEEVPKGAKVLKLSGDELGERLADGRVIPEWFSFPEVVEQLRRTHPPRYKQGFTVFITGLSGSGKSTIANALLVRFLQLGERPVTLLDGDIVRRNLSSELGFSKEHRNINIRRIGFVASEITKNGGIAICAPIAPYDQVRREVRDMIEEHGGFAMVYVSTPLDVCEQRDRKGLYAKARAGIIKEFTGISDPYESPDDADVVINTTDISPDEAAQDVILHLERKGYIGVGDK